MRRFKSKDILVIPIAMLLFALGGSTFGMAEETLPFFAIFLPIMIAMGFDSLTAFMIVFIGAKAGYIASTVNPFSVLIAQASSASRQPAAVAARHHVRGDRGSVHRVGGALCPQGAQESRVVAHLPR